jgi:hypothetical protein
MSVGTDPVVRAAQDHHNRDHEPPGVPGPNRLPVSRSARACPLTAAESGTGTDAWEGRRRNHRTWSCRYASTLSVGGWEHRRSLTADSSGVRRADRYESFLLRSLVVVLWLRWWAAARGSWRRYWIEQERIQAECSHDGSGRQCLVCCVQFGLR